MKRLLSLAVSSGARDTYLLTAGNLGDAFVAFLFTVISFRLLSAPDFGLFSGFNNLIFSASLVLDLGLSQSLLYYLPQQNDIGKNSLVGSGLFLRVLISAVFSLLLILFAPILSARVFPDSDLSMIYLSSAAIVFASLIDVMVYSLQGSRRFLQAVIVSNAYSLARFLLVLIILQYSLAYTAHVALVITLIGPLVGIILGFVWLKPNWPSWKLAKKLLSFGGFMGIYRICQIIALRSDVQIVLTSLGATAAGTYSVAARMGNFYPLIIVTLNSLYASRLRLQRELSADFLKKSLFLLFIVCLLMLLCAWQAPLIIKLLFGAKAVGAGLIYRYLTLAYLPLMAATLPISILVFYHSNTKFIGFLGVVQVITMLVLSFTLISEFHQLATIISLSVANSLVFILSCLKVIKLWK